MRRTFVAQFILIVLAAGSFAAGALAQGPPPGRGGRGRMGFDGGPGPGGPMMDSGSGILRAGVKNAPFSADVVTESTHTLADGNRTAGGVKRRHVAREHRAENAAAVHWIRGQQVEGAQRKIDPKDGARQSRCRNERVL